MLLSDRGGRPGLERAIEDLQAVGPARAIAAGHNVIILSDRG